MVRRSFDKGDFDKNYQTELIRKSAMSLFEKIGYKKNDYTGLSNHQLESDRATTKYLIPEDDRKIGMWIHLLFYLDEKLNVQVGQIREIVKYNQILRKWLKQNRQDIHSSK